MRFELLHRRSFLLFTFALLFLHACQKDKIDNNAEMNGRTNEQANSRVANPTFRIRIVNRMETMPDTVVGNDEVYPLEDLVGPVTLTYADGTPVSAETTNIDVNTASGYIDLPYGTYQFRLLTADGRQISTVTAEQNIDPESSRLFKVSVPASEEEVENVDYSDIENMGVSALTQAAIDTYQPGVSYTLNVRPYPFRFKTMAFPYSAEAQQNQFLILPDELEGSNSQYGKIQGVNVYAQGAVDFRIGGTATSAAIGYGKASEYTILEEGKTTVEALDQSGNVLAKTEVTLDAGQNISVWLWQNVDGKAELLPVYNDLSNEHFVYSNPEYGKDNRREGDLATTGIRFLNLCPDEPYISFTLDDGLDMRESPVAKTTTARNYERPTDDAIYNLQPGVPSTTLPYTRWIPEYGIPFNFLAFRSEPGIVPDTWLKEVPLLNSAQFTANPALYTKVGRETPDLEPGIYTVALVGSQGGTENPAKMIIVKHNR